MNKLGETNTNEIKNLLVVFIIKRHKRSRSPNIKRSRVKFIDTGPLHGFPGFVSGGNKEGISH